VWGHDALPTLRHECDTATTPRPDLFLPFSAGRERGTPRWSLPLTTAAFPCLPISRDDRRGDAISARPPDPRLGAPPAWAAGAPRAPAPAPGSAARRPPAAGAAPRTGKGRSSPGRLLADMGQNDRSMSGPPPRFSVGHPPGEKAFWGRSPQSTWRRKRPSPVCRSSQTSQLSRPDSATIQPMRHRSLLSPLSPMTDVIAESICRVYRVRPHLGHRS
jgi:hypothetical protein